MESIKQKISEAWRIGDDEGVEMLLAELRNTSAGTERLSVERLEGDATLPTRGSAGSAGIDLYALRGQMVLPSKQQSIRTGVAVDIPQGMVGMIWPRSGLAAKHGIDTMAGVIDSDYTGEIIVLLRNHGDMTVRINAGERIAQMVIQPYNHATVVEVDKIPSKISRGDDGFGSTGR